MKKADSVLIMLVISFFTAAKPKTLFQSYIIQLIKVYLSYNSKSRAGEPVEIDKDGLATSAIM